MVDDEHTDMTWKDAIVTVLRDVGKPMHYKVIAEEIADRGLRSSLGADPADTVSTQVNKDLRENGQDSLFFRAEPGRYTLRELAEQGRDFDAGGRRGSPRWPDKSIRNVLAKESRAVEQQSEPVGEATAGSRPR